MNYDFWGNLARKNGHKTQTPDPQSRPWWDTSLSPREAESRQTVNYYPATNESGLSQEELEILDASTKHADMVRKSANESCPHCSGNNYASLGRVVSNQGSFENKQCWDCGYPVNHDGVPPGHVSITGAGRARQTNAGGKIINNYHPKNTVAGRIG